LKRAGATFLAAAALGACLVGGCGGEAVLPALTETQQAELDTLTGQLGDTTRSPQTKLDAAALLLSRPYPQAEQALVGFLSDSADPSAQLAAAEAMARRGRAPAAAVEPLFALLESEEPAIRLAAARALAACGDEGVTDRLVSLAGNDEAAPEARVAVIRGLGGVFDKQVVEVMVELLDDPRRDIQDAAADSLADLTSIRAFGRDRARWKAWWAENKSKKRERWLADLVERFGKTVDVLEAENASLRNRLAEVTRGLYDAAPPEQRDAMLLGLLTDPIADVRLIGMDLLQQKLAANEQIAPDARQLVRGMLSDPDRRCRSAAAMLLAGLGDAGSLSDLLIAVRNEGDAAVRQGLLSALGQLRKPQALGVVLAEVSSPDDDVSAAAAEALARIIEANAPSDEVRSSAAEALSARYLAAADRIDGTELREALLTAMGAVGDGELVGVIQGALRDRAAAVRLAAVGALAKLRDRSSSDLLAELMGDPDRGVRRAAVAALGVLGGAKHLDEVLKRTDPSSEPDAEVRTEAWKVVTAALAKSAPEVMRAVADKLAGRADAADYRIKVLEMLAGALAGSKDQAEADALRQLGLALVKAGRLAEAESPLAKSWRIYESLASAQGLDVWREWVDALLATDDPAVVKALNDQVNDEAFEAALAKLMARLSELAAAGKHTTVLLLAGAALEQLPHRLTIDQRQTIEKLAADSLIARKQADRQEVARLLAQLQTADPQAQQAALKRLAELGKRAVPALLAGLADCLHAQQIDESLEKAIISALEQAAPELKGYDLTADRAQKLKVLEQYLLTDK